MRLGERSDLVYENVWLPLEKKLTADELELLFWLDLVQTDERAKQSDTYVGQQKRLEKLTTPQGIEDEVLRIAKLGDVFSTILDPKREPDPEIRARLARIQAWGSNTAYPVVMRLLDRKVSGTATVEQVTKALTYLESYFVRRIIIGRATANLNRTLLQAVPAIADAEQVDLALRDYLSRGRKYFATDKQVREAVGTVPFYWQGRGNQKKLILLWLEESYGSKEPVEPQKLTIEHVLPQTLTDAVRESFAGGLPDDADVTYEHEKIVHTIGNLTLSGYNPELSNRPFQEKRVLLDESGLRMNREIAAQGHWGANEINRRGADLAERIISIWPGPDESVVGQNGEEPSALRSLVASIVAEIPAGHWTSYGEVALVAGSYPQPVAALITNHQMPNAWRVLQSGGAISPRFRWTDTGRTEDPREYLESEGLEFDADGHASQEQFISAAELAERTGLEVDEEAALWRSNGIAGPNSVKSQQRAFFDQVRELGSATSKNVNSWKKALPQNWMNVSIGSSRAAVVLYANSVRPRVGCALYIGDDKQLFADLYSQREQIEAELGVVLEWQELPDKKASRIVVFENGDFRDEEESPHLVEWLVEMADRFARVFPDYIRSPQLPL